MKLAFSSRRKSSITVRVVHDASVRLKEMGNVALGTEAEMIRLFLEISNGMVRSVPFLIPTGRIKKCIQRALI